MKQNKVSYSKGITWIDDCRIPFVDDKDCSDACKKNKEKIKYTEDTIWEKSGVYNYKRTGGNIQGRFPANILVSDDMLNDGNITKNGDIKPHKQKRKTLVFNSNEVISTFKSDKGTNSRYYDIDKWFDKIIND